MLNSAPNWKKASEFLDRLTDEEKTLLAISWEYIARTEQLPPDGDWTTWIFLGGRGAGKTRAGAEWVRSRAERGLAKRIALVAGSANDGRFVMIEGDSGLLSVCPDDYKPNYEPSKRLLVWPDGVIATLYSAEEPDALRGPQHDTAWCDELAKWNHLEATWDNYELAGQISGANRMGHLTANLAASSGEPDSTDALYVDLSESEGDLATGTISSSGTLNLPLCYVVNYNSGTGVWSGGELLYYETSTLVSQTATNETHVVPSAAPFTVLVDNAASFLSDGGVSAANPFFPLVYVAMTYTSGTPASGQYTVSNGLYVFNTAQAGYLLRIDYDYGNPYHYALTNLYRAQYGTAGGTHATGDLFARLDNSIFEYDLPTAYVGQPIYIKLVSINIYGNGLEDISMVSPYLYTPTGAGIPPNQTAGGNYTVTSGDVTAGQSSIPTGLAAIASESVTIKRSGSVVTSNATIAASGSDIVVASGPSGTGSYVLTAGDVIAWLAVA